MSNMVVVENQAKKWGNSFGFIIPAEIAKQINLKEGQVVEIEIKLKKRVNAFGRFSGAKRFREEKLTHKKFW